MQVKPAALQVLRPLSKAVLCVALLSSLQGCIAVVAGAAVGGAFATVDRRSLGAQTEDKAIAVKADTRLPGIVGDAGHVNVNSYNRKVLLTGEVRDEAMKRAVENEVRSIANVDTVSNELEIAGPSSYTSRSSDALITSKVKLSLADKNTIKATSFKVVTERGNVYLMGLVTQREGNIAAQVAQGVAGVMRVTKIFEYISEEDLRSLQPQQAQAQ
ncbi:BON domain-containing protein [Herbaspirillum sp. SJZ107]|uniref:BON domain-containing protein n=1 Tax=Herbaspirillum sp. SJZ107 TaxID=2572881 RepID=UPI00115261EF|nr:BON domain-containing protein [Herbaspirillum sp. SJZ107]TQK05445.1 osmotically-inducible protein OsmY [Herbaspirillum sp. SJZ107]